MSDSDTAIGALVKTSSVKNGQIKINQKLLDSALKIITEDLKKENSVTIPKNFFEEILWPSWSSEKTDSHVLLIAAGIVSKLDHHGDFKSFESDRLHDFILRLLQIFHKEDDSYLIKTLIVKSLNALFLNLQINEIRKELAPFVSILIWGSIDDYENLLSQHDLQAQYSKQLKSLDKLSKKEKAESLLKTNWISNSIDVAINNFDAKNTESMNYTKSILVLLRDLLAQLPTRKFLKTQLLRKDIHLQLSSLQINDEDFVSALNSYIFYLKFPVDELTGEVITSDTIENSISDNFLKLQVLSNSLFSDKLQDLAFATYDHLEDTSKLKDTLLRLDSGEFTQLFKNFDFTLPKACDTGSLADSFNFQLSPFINLQTYLENLGDFINDQTIIQQGTNSAAKLTGQYLSQGDYLVRNYLLYRQESFIEIKAHLERTVTRLTLKTDKGKEKLTGKSNYVSSLSPSDITLNDSSGSADLIVSLSEFSNDTTKDWSSLKYGDAILLVKQGVKFPKGNDLEKLGIIKIATAVIKSSSKSKSSLNLKVNVKGFTQKNGSNSEKDEQPFTLALRLPKSLTKYHQKLEKIWKSVNISEDSLPEWLYDHVLGLGSNTSDELNLKGPIKLLFGDISKESIEQSFPGKTITIEGQETKKRKVDSENSDSITSPFTINTNGEEVILQQIEIDQINNSTKFNDLQVKALIKSLCNGITLVEGPPGSGKKHFITSSIKSSIDNYSNEKILVISKNEGTSKQLFQSINKVLDGNILFNLSDSQVKQEKIESSNIRLGELLLKVDELASSIGLEPLYGDSGISALQFFTHQIKPSFERFLIKVKENKTVEALKNSYPFTTFGSFNLEADSSFVDNLKYVVKHYTSIATIFHEIEDLSPLSLSKNQDEIFDHLLVTYGKVVGVSAEYYPEFSENFEKLNLKFDTIIISDASQLNEFETVFPLVLNHNPIKRALLVGDTISSSSTEQSFIGRLKNQGFNIITLNQIYDRSPELVELVEPYYPAIPSVNKSAEIPNAGILETIKLIEFTTKETNDGRAVIGSALYASKLYQFLVSIGYPKESITILTLDPLHEALLKEVFADSSPVISTIEGYRGQSSDIVILPLNDTPSNLDDELLALAVSTSRRGFYIFGQSDVIKSDDLKNNSSLQKIYKKTKDHKLKLVKGETFGNVTRKVNDKVSPKEVNFGTIENLIGDNNS